jgi:hypothetical protein
MNQLWTQDYETPNYYAKMRLADKEEKTIKEATSQAIEIAKNSGLDFVKHKDVVRRSERNGELELLVYFFPRKENEK